MPGHYEKKKEAEEKKRKAQRAQEQRNRELTRIENKGGKSQNFERDSQGNAQRTQQRVSPMTNNNRKSENLGRRNPDAGTGSVKDMKKKKKSKSFMQKLFNKLKIKRGGRGMGGEMPLTNLDVKKLGSRRSKLR